MARARRGHGHGHARQVAWDLMNFGQETLTIDGSLLYGGFVATVEGLTIIRLRGEVVIDALLGTAGDSAEIAIGMIVVSDEAFAAGAASIPSPITDADDDWMFHQWCSVGSRLVGAAGQGSSYRFQVDNKSMRKLPVGKTVVCVAEMASEVGVVSADLSLNLRALLKLP